ncbi:MAG: hypothetical protein ACK5KT_14840 [Dysgonomonas sp.]
MKKATLILLLLISLPVFSQKRCVIEGKIEGLPEGAIVSLESLAHEEFVIFNEKVKSEATNGYFKVETEEKPLFELSMDYTLPLWKLKIPLYKKHKSDGIYHRYWLRIIHDDLPLFTGVYISLSGVKNTNIYIEGSMNTSPKEWKIKSNLKDQKECNLYSKACYDYIKEGYELYRKFCQDQDSAKRDLIRSLSDSINNLRYAAEMRMAQEKSSTDFNLYILGTLARSKSNDSKFMYGEEVEKIYDTLTEKEKKSYNGILAAIYLKRKNSLKDAIF